MKHLFVILIAAVCLTACKTQDKNSLSEEQKRNALKDSSKFTSIEWLDSTYTDRGKIKEGTTIEVSYRFKNTGKYNLIIADVSAQCGCTTPDKPREPISPGKEGVIKAKFNSQGHPGENRKNVYVLANTLPQNSMTLTFRAEVTN